MHFYSELKDTKKLIKNKQIRKHIQSKVQNKETTQLVVAATTLFTTLVGSYGRQL